MGTGAERKAEIREGEPSGVVTVCNARLVWKNPEQCPNTLFTYVSDDERELFTQAGLREVAAWMVGGIGLSRGIYDGGREPEMDYQAPRGTEEVWALGYFRKPRILAEVYELTDFRPEQIEELETYLAELRD